MRDARVVTLKNRRKGCEMRRGATCCVGGARCEGVRDAHYNVISVLGVRDAYFFRGVRVTVPSKIILKKSFILNQKIFKEVIRKILQLVSH